MQRRLSSGGYYERLYFFHTYNNYFTIINKFLKQNFSFIFNYNFFSTFYFKFLLNCSLYFNFSKIEENQQNILYFKIKFLIKISCFSSQKNVKNRSQTLGNLYKMSRNKDKYESGNRRQQIFMSAEDVAAGKKSNWTGIEITGKKY